MDPLQTILVFWTIPILSGLGLWALSEIFNPGIDRPFRHGVEQ